MVNLPTSSTSYFVNFHFVNIDQMGIDNMGIDKVGINKIGIDKVGFNDVGINPSCRLKVSIVCGTLFILFLKVSREIFVSDIYGEQNP